MSDRPTDSRHPLGINRRTFLKQAGAVGVGSLLASRLSNPDSAFAQDSTVKVDPSGRRGGTLRFGVNSSPAHFDVHQSNSVSNIGAQAPMYDLLIRRDPRDGQ